MKSWVFTEWYFIKLKGTKPSEIKVPVTYLFISYLHIVYVLTKPCLHIIYVVVPNYLTSRVADKIMSIRRKTMLIQGAKRIYSLIAIILPWILINLHGLFYIRLHKLFLNWNKVWSFQLASQSDSSYLRSCSVSPKPNSRSWTFPPKSKSPITSFL